MSILINTQTTARKAELNSAEVVHVISPQFYSCTVARGTVLDRIGAILARLGLASRIECRDEKIVYVPIMSCAQRDRLRALAADSTVEQKGILPTFVIQRIARLRRDDLIRKMQQPSQNQAYQEQLQELVRTFYQEFKHRFDFSNTIQEPDGRQSIFAGSEALTLEELREYLTLVQPTDQTTEEEINYFEALLEEINNVLPPSEEDETEAPADTPSLPNPTDTSSLPKLKQLIDHLGKSWSQKNKDFQNINFNESQFIQRVQDYLTTFKAPFNPETDIGFIEKRDLPPGTKIFVRADTHGDLKSPVENLLSLQREGAP